MQQDLIEIETKLAYQEDLIDQLNEVVTDQQKSIARLFKKIEKLEKVLVSSADNGTKDISQEVPPPHY